MAFGSPNRWGKVLEFGWLISLHSLYLSSKRLDVSEDSLCKELRQAVSLNLSSDVEDQESGKSLGEMLPLTSGNEFLPEKEEDCPVTRGGLVCECDACSITPGCSSTDQVK